MTEPHLILNIHKDATETEIKRAYKQKVRTSHPDKGGSVDAFQTLTTAYQQMLKPFASAQDITEADISEDEAEEEDGITINGMTFSSPDPWTPQFENREPLRFELIDNPFQYTNYEYLEKAFAKEEFLEYDPEYFDRPLIERAHKVHFMFSKMKAIIGKITIDVNQFSINTRMHIKWYVPPATIQHHKTFYENQLKLSSMCDLMESGHQEAKALYDHSIDLLELTDDELPYLHEINEPATLQELKALVLNMGGTEVLKSLIAIAPRIGFMPFLRKMNQAGLLTKPNMQSIIGATKTVNTPWFINEFYEDKLFLETDLYFPTHYNPYRDKEFLNALENSVSCLNECNLLTQSNYDLLFTNPYHLRNIAWSLCNMHRNGLLTQAKFEKTIHLGYDSRRYTGAFMTLMRSGCYNDEILNALSNTNITDYIHYGPEYSKSNFDETHEQAFQWQGPNEIKPLQSAINQLFIHGLTLGSHRLHDFGFGGRSVRKAGKCIVLAITLKKELHDFWQQSDAPTQQALDEFKEHFTQTLHQFDEALSTHRDLWFEIKANILTALTGIGLIPMTINYCLTGRFCLFQPASTHKVADIEKTLEKTATPHKPIYTSMMYHM